jgi:hypothetical protein
LSDTLARYRANYQVTNTVKAFKRLQELADKKAPVAQAELELELSVLDFIEAQTYDFLTAQGIPSLEQQYLIGFQKRLWKMALKFEGSTYNQSRGLLTEEYILRGHTDLETVAIREGLYLIVARAKIFKLSGVLLEVMLSRVRVHQTFPGGSQSFASGTPAKVAFDAVEFDTLSEWDVANNKFTALEGGYYLVHGLVTWGALLGPTDELLDLMVFVNNSIVAEHELREGYVTYAVQMGMQIQALVHLDVGDYVELWATQTNTSGTARTMNGGTTGCGVNFSIMRLTPGAD